MAFKVLFISKAPDADYNKHKSIIDTGKYRLLTSVVKKSLLIQAVVQVYTTDFTEINGNLNL